MTFSFKVLILIVMDNGLSLLYILILLCLIALS